MRKTMKSANRIVAKEIVKTNPTVKRNKGEKLWSRTTVCLMNGDHDWLLGEARRQGVSPSVYIADLIRSQKEHSKQRAKFVRDKKKVKDTIDAASKLCYKLSRLSDNLK